MKSDIKTHAKNEGARGADRALDMNFDKSDGIWTMNAMIVSKNQGS